MPHATSAKSIVLASSSKFRQQLLKRLKLDFVISPPDINEEPLQSETAKALVARLAKEKAHRVADQHPHALIIASDEVADLHGRIIGKPTSKSNARAQLKSMSGQTVVFYTSLYLLDSADKTAQASVIPFEVEFKALTETMIERYLEQEQPYHSCASFQSETSAIALTKKMSGDDPTSLMGLPLIKLVEFLEQAGVSVFSAR